MQTASRTWHAWRVSQSHQSWLDLVHEDVIEPGLPIVDPHHHLWDFREARGFQPRYLVEDLREDTSSGHNIEKTVFIECQWMYRDSGPEHLRCIGETERVAVAAAQTRAEAGPPIAAIISSCDLRLDAVRLGEVLEAHEDAGGGLFRGIRHRLAHDPTGGANLGRGSSPEDLMGSPAFRTGVAELGRRGHSFEAWLYHLQLPSLLHLAAVAPETTIVLNHIGAPLGVGVWASRRAEVEQEWRESMAAIAKHDNVVLKLGGIGMDIYGMGWEGNDRPPTSDEIAAAYGDKFRFMIDQFGPQRCMFESNFPVDKMSFSYHVWWNAAKKMSADLSPAERDALFRTTASRVYRL